MSSYFWRSPKCRFIKKIMGRVINIEETIAKAERKRAEGPPLPVVVRRERKEAPKSIQPTTPAIELPATGNRQPANTKDLILKDLWKQLADLKTERGKLSTSIARRVEAKATQDELRDLYERINNFTPLLQQLWNQIKFVEAHGELPTTRKVETPTASMELLALKERKRSLINTRNKLNKNLRPNARAPKNSDRIIYWQEQLALQNAEYEEIQLKIKRLEYEQRTGSE